MQPSKVTQLLKLANHLAARTPGFFDVKGPGEGNLATNEYIKALAMRSIDVFEHDYSERKICGENSLAVDFYFPDEGAIVEVALGLKNPNTEFEKDILKAIMAKSLGNFVKDLHLIGKPGAIRKCAQPGRTAVKQWLESTHGINLSIHDLSVA